MAETILMFAVVVALLTFIVVLEVIHVKERRTMMNAIIARNPSELRTLNRDVDAFEPSRVNSQPSQEEVEFWAFGDPVGGIS